MDRTPSVCLRFISEAGHLNLYIRFFVFQTYFYCQNNKSHDWKLNDAIFGFSFFYYDTVQVSLS